MKTMLIYDSVYGNTESIAKAIGDAVPGGAQVRKVGTADSHGLGEIGLLIIGSPTHGGRPTPAMQSFLDGIQGGALKGVKVATFDTRFASRMTKIFGYAAPRAASTLQSKGGVLAVPPEGFIVRRKDGPLKEGELERAAAWAKGLA